MKYIEHWKRRRHRHHRHAGHGVDLMLADRQSRKRPWVAAGFFHEWPNIFSKVAKNAQKWPFFQKWQKGNFFRVSIQLKTCKLSINTP